MKPSGFDRLARNGFDRLARPYRWMEYLSFGRALERCRFRFLPQLGSSEHALLLGDGDGRFAARLLRVAPRVRVDAVDASAAMLERLRARCDDVAAGHVVTHQVDLAQGLPASVHEERFDLVTTHFLLDCLTTEQVVLLAKQVKPLLRNDALWVISEFAVPQQGAMRWPALVMVRSLYLAFRVLTGLRTQRLPRYEAALRNEGFERIAFAPFLGGLLVSEMWQRKA